MNGYDAAVVGAGPNGLAAAITLAEAGLSVLVVEAEDTIGGGARSAELTRPGFVHDLCSAVHPLAVASPFFRRLPLERYGLEWIHPPAPLAHPLDDGTAVILERSLETTASALGPDADAYGSIFGRIIERWEDLVEDILGPLRVPRHPLTLARFGLRGLRSATGVARSAFEGVRARALFAGLAAHSVLPLTRAGSAAFGLVLGGAGHAVGWPIPKGGAGRISAALAAHLRSLGGEVRTGERVSDLSDLPRARAAFLDLTPRQVLSLAGDRLSGRYRRRLQRFRYGPAAFKVDWALSGPIPWKAAECARAGTVHVGGTLEEVAESEAAAWEGSASQAPFVLLAQPTLFDPTRAPRGRHVAWAYCHVPNGSKVDMKERIEAQVERFAPGFRDRIIDRAVHAPADLEARNANLVGGDISGGSLEPAQLLFRPRALRPYATPASRVYLCSASTPPGPGVHGMCGHFAARAALGAGL